MTKSEFSIIKRFSLKSIFLICILLLGLDALNLIRFKFVTHHFLDTPVWFPFSLGTVLILIALTKIYYNFEKIGISLYGLAFMLDAFSSLFGYQYLLFISAGLELLAIYFFLSFKIKIEKIEKK